MKHTKFKSIYLFLPVICLLALSLPVHADALSNTDLIIAKLQERLSVTVPETGVVCRGKTMCRSPYLRQLYAKRTLLPCWSKDGVLTANADAMIKVIRDAPSHGLYAQDYHLGDIEVAMTELLHDTRKGVQVNIEKIVNLELLLTDAFLLYGTHMLVGRIDPNKTYAAWVAKPRSADITDVMISSLATNQIAKALSDLQPQYAGYEMLRKTLADYRLIAAKGGWPTISGGKNVNLKKGSHSNLVPLLWMRLMLSGDLDVTKASEGAHFDDGMKNAVEKFQRRHGLKDDGVVRSETLKALNVPVEKRISQIEMNLERWRWLPHDLGQRYILVNIPDFSMEVIKNNEVAMDMRIVVGKRIRNPKTDTRTPVFTGRMTHLEINPYWNVPFSIASKELLPKIKQDPTYLSKKNMQLLSGKGKVEPTTVDWTKIHTGNFRYQIRQNPGAFNALSRIKFLFPNRFDVYLHDTPSRNLFKRSPRDFSHGCMRIEKPIDLAIHLLNDENNWSRDRIMATIRKGRNHPVNLPEPIDVNVQYWTSWIDSEGAVQFRNDLYNYDAILEKTIAARPTIYIPTATTTATTGNQAVRAAN